MNNELPLNRRAFGQLLIWRSLIALAALYSVLEKPIDQIILALVVLWLLLLVGELSYRYSVQREQQREQRRRDREWREQRAEEARQRFAAIQAEAEAEKHRPRVMSLDYDEMTEPPPKPASHSIERLSTEEFDLALLEAEQAPRR